MADDQQFLDLPGLEYLWDRAVDTFMPKNTDVIDYEAILQKENIPGTTQNISFSDDGNVSRITHSNNSGIVRTDTFVFDNNTITETRVLATGHTLTIVTDLETLVTTTTYSGV